MSTSLFKVGPTGRRHNIGLPIGDFLFHMRSFVDLDLHTSMKGLEIMQNRLNSNVLELGRHFRFICLILELKWR